LDMASSMVLVGLFPFSAKGLSQINFAKFREFSILLLWSLVN